MTKSSLPKTDQSSSPMPDIKAYPTYQPCHLCDDQGGVSYTIASDGWPQSVSCDVCGLCAPDWYIRKLKRQLVERNTGKQTHRTKGEIGAREATFAKHWASLNRGRPGLNSGATALALLLREERTREDHEENIPQPTERDYMIAATVIQWLGTNGGRCFLSGVAKDLEACRRGTLL